VSALQFDDVAIDLGGRNILSAASFVIRGRRFIGMLGANGAGKTTRLERPTARRMASHTQSPTCLTRAR
jgi:ABC-type cobalamin/Fe3+-siderophores transport system ATPase subunit